MSQGALLGSMQVEGEGMGEAGALGLQASGQVC